jgi:nucleoside-diphosphate-sugar epimerase
MPYIETYMTPFPFVVDMQHRRAAIPGTGNEPMTFTYTKDLAKFVVAMLDLEKWEEETFLYGEKTTWNEFVRVAEEVLGKCKRAPFLSGLTWWALIHPGSYCGL